MKIYTNYQIENCFDLEQMDRMRSELKNTLLMLEDTTEVLLYGIVEEKLKKARAQRGKIVQMDSRNPLSKSL
jgi:hypothetical protein